MKNSRQIEIFIYVSFLLALALVKLKARQLGPDFYQVFLWLTTQFTSLFSGHSFVAFEGGYLARETSIIIDQSCSGLNFFILTCIVFIMAKRWRPKPLKAVLKGLGVFLLTSFAYASLANSFRITLSIFTLNINSAYGEGMFHRGLGIFVYLSFLILFYQLLIFVRDKYDFNRFNQKPAL